MIPRTEHVSDKASDSFFNLISLSHTQRESPLVKTGMRCTVTMAAVTCLFIHKSLSTDELCAALTHS